MSIELHPCAHQHAPVAERVRAGVVEALVPLAAELALAKQGVGVAERAIGVDCRNGYFRTSL